METKTVLISGSQGFLGGYMCREFLGKGYNVIGIDNYSKYGVVKRDYDNHPNFTFFQWDLSFDRCVENLISLLIGCDYIVACAAMIGGISYFHKYAYDLLAHNERIMANTFDAAIRCYHMNSIKRIIIVSSSMVYEGADAYDAASTYPDSIWPSKEEELCWLPPPNSTYGLQKLACEYYAKGAYEQYGLPYTIVRPFNCIGVGEEDSISEEKVMSGNIKLMMSHVLPDLINKILKGQDPLRILGDGSQIRHYTHGKDMARGIRLATESDKATGESFNISSSRSTTVLELAEIVWREIYGETRPFRYESDAPYKYDVQRRMPDVTKARELLGFETKISLEDSVAEVVKEMKRKFCYENNNS